MSIDNFISAGSFDIKGFPISAVIGDHSVYITVVGSNNFVASGAPGFNIQTHVKMIIAIFTKIRGK